MIYQEFLAIDKIYELASFDPSERLRFAIHEIVIGLKEDQRLTFEQLCIELKKYKIYISVDIIKKIFEDWDRYNNPDYSILKKEDKAWLDLWAYQSYMKKKTRDKQNFGKHRKKIDYNRGYTGTRYGGYGMHGNDYYYGD